MTIPGPSRADRNPEPTEAPDNPGPSGHSRPEKKPAQQVARDVFEKHHYNGLEGTENSPEIYPVYRAANQSADGVTCEVCGREKEDCVC